MKLLLQRNLKHYRARYVICAIIAALTTILTCAIVTLNVSNAHDVSNARDRLGADVAVVGAGYEGSLEAILFDGAIGTLRLSREWENKLRNLEEVDDIASQTYLGTLPGASCCDGEIQLIAFDPQNDFQISPYLPESCKDLQSDEIILGNNFIVKPGDTVKYYNKEFTVKALMDRTSLGIDSAAYISYDALAEMITDERNDTLHELEGMTSVIYVRSNQTNADVLGNMILSTLGRQEIAVVKVRANLDSLSQVLRQSSLTLYYVLAAVIAMSLLSMFTLNTFTLLSRRMEIGALLVRNVSLRSVIKLYTQELVCVTGVPVIVSTVCFGTLLLAFSQPIIYALACGGVFFAVCSILSYAVSEAVINELLKGHDTVDLLKEVY